MIDNPPVWPEQLTPELHRILGMMCFQLAAPADLYRKYDGAEIPHKAESEQAFMLHRLIGYWFEHGGDWAKHAQADLNRLKDARAASRSAGE